MTIDENAPAISKGEIQINSSPEIIWDIISDIEKWPQWNPDIKWASLDGKLTAETTFQWKSGPGKITSKIQTVEPPNQIAWTGKTMGISAVHVWKIEPEDNITIVKTEESWNGLIVYIFRKSMQKKLDEAIESVLQYLKAEAEKKVLQS
ncbi:polyketide cyclase [Candidatus Poribacteria bacterium]|nr:polyketide cyclase [Candidatus Poribacteria bacterium]